MDNKGIVEKFYFCNERGRKSQSPAIIWDTYEDKIKKFNLK